MSKLKDWILQHQTTQEKVSFALKISYRYLHGIVNGQYTPSKKLAQRIEKLTQGEISAISLLFPDSISHAVRDEISISSDR